MEENPKIVFENEFFMAVHKPAHWLSIPSRLGEKDERPDVKSFLQKTKKVWPVHRLDEQVSGLLLFALDAKAHQVASRWFEKQEIVKEYEAHTEIRETAFQPQQKFRWQSLLLRGKKRAYEKPFGKMAVTEAEFLGESRFVGIGSFRWRLWAITGKPHQLRFEMSKQGFPILNDVLYGAKPQENIQGIALKCVRLEFTKCADYQEFKLPEFLQLESN